jgi:hypothetical protein
MCALAGLAHADTVAPRIPDTPAGQALGAPITKTDWEGKGLEPDLKVPAEQALAAALKLATAGSNARN